MSLSHLPLKGTEGRNALGAFLTATQAYMRPRRREPPLEDHIWEAPWGLNNATVPYTNYPANSIRAARCNSAFFLTSWIFVANFLPVVPPERQSKDVFAVSIKKTDKKRIQQVFTGQIIEYKKTATSYSTIAS